MEPVGCTTSASTVTTFTTLTTLTSDAKDADPEKPRPHPKPKRRRRYRWPQPLRRRTRRCESQPVIHPADGWGAWFRETIAPRHMVYILLLQAFSAGLLDAKTYADFEVFASNQTGNLILMTLAAVGTVPVKALLAGASLGGFYLAAFLYGHLGTYVGARQRRWLMTSLTSQILLMIASTILTSPTGPASTHAGGKYSFVVLLLLAVMSGAQVTAAQQSKCPEVVSAPMTSPMTQLVIDPHLFSHFTHKDATARNRRLVYVLTVTTGSFIGAAMHKYANNYSITIVAIGFKVFAVGAVGLSPGQ